MNEIIFEKLSAPELIKLSEILNIELKCSQCGAEITPDNIGGVFNSPNRVICNNILCLSEIIGE